MQSNIKATGSPDLFKNPIINKLTRTNIWVPLIIFYGTSMVVLMYYIFYKNISIIATLLWFLCGLLFFTLIEYFVHRVIFHIETNTERKKRFQYVMHGVHHEYPKDKMRLAMPPLLSVVLASVLLSFFNLVFGYFGMPFGSGFLFGYATYLCVHYSVHAFSMPKNFLKYLWIHHAKHHYQDGRVAFGVSSPFWDIVFSTMPKK